MINVKRAVCIGMGRKEVVLLYISWERGEVPWRRGQLIRVLKHK